MTWQHRHPLAFTLDRDPIPLPPAAAAWRVRHVPRGSMSLRRGDAPEPVNGLDGSPLYLRLTDSRAELARQAQRGGLFRLDAVDAGLHLLRSVEPAYVEVPQTVSGDLGVVLALCDVALRLALPPPPLPRKQEALQPAASTSLVQS